MRTLVGTAVVVLGVILVMSGLGASDFLISRVSSLFAGSLTNRSMWLVIGGTLAVMIGVVMACFRRVHRV